MLDAVRIAVARPLAAVLLAVAISAAYSPTAHALEPGVHADPGSPAAKEYALPLTQARRTGSGGSSHNGGGLFGAGIGPARRGGSAAQAPASQAPGRHTRRSAGRDSAASAASGSADRAGAGLPAAVSSASRTSASARGDGSTLALLGGGVAVLALGALGGTVLRGRRSASST
jgi:hypothetical protein